MHTWRPVPLETLALHRLSVSLRGAKHGAKPQATHPPVDMPTQYGRTCPCCHAIMYVQSRFQRSEPTGLQNTPSCLFLQQPLSLGPAEGAS